MIIVGILDDQIKQVDCLHSVVSDFFKEKGIDCKIITSTTGAEFMKHADDYMIVFLDINVGDENGVNIGKKLRETNVKTLVIYVTGFEEYRVAAQDTRYFYYLRKPVTKENIIQHLADGMRYVEVKHKIRIFDTNNGILSLKISDIIYCEAQEHGSVVYLINGHYKINHTLTKVKEIVGDDFEYISRSCLINLAHVREVDENQIITIDGSTIPIAARRVSEFCKNFKGYCHKLWG